jgi:TRAP-type mannitol/chloroaromatic compound transport system permease small subunit
MGFCRVLIRCIDGLNRHVGQAAAWLALAMVLVQFVVVGMRYVFGVGSIMLQESVIYLHAFLFMVGAGYTLQRDGHVRVDIFYRAASAKRKAVVDLLGVVLLLFPVCMVIGGFAWPYVESSWAVFEGSRETSGIQAVFLLKSVVLVFCVLVMLQALSLALRSVFVLAGCPVPDDRVQPTSALEK